MSLAPDRATRERLRQACDAVNAGLARRRRWLVWAGIVAAVAIGVVVLRAPAFAPHTAAAGVALIGALAVYVRASAGREYKASLALELIPLLRPGLTFHAHGSMGRDEFNALRLFSRSADRVVAQDELRGERNGVAFAVEELRATYTTSSGSGRSRRRTTHTLFRGSVVRLEFNKHFHGHTIVVPRQFGAGWLDGLVAGLFGGTLDAITMEDPEFERAFATRATDEQEARYLLTPRFMELVLAARARHGDALRLAFRDGTLHVLLPGTRDRFEVPLFGGLSPSDAVGDLEAVLALAEDLVATLDLETRIWSRT